MAGAAAYGGGGGMGGMGGGGMGAMASAAVSAGSATVNYAASAVASSMARGPNSMESNFNLVLSQPDVNQSFYP